MLTCTLQSCGKCHSLTLCRPECRPSASALLTVPHIAAKHIRIFAAGTASRPGARPCRGIGPAGINPRPTETENYRAGRRAGALAPPWGGMVGRGVAVHVPRYGGMQGWYRCRDPARGCGRGFVRRAGVNAIFPHSVGRGLDPAVGWYGWPGCGRTCPAVWWNAGVESLPGVAGFAMRGIVGCRGCFFAGSSLQEGVGELFL